MNQSPAGASAGAVPTLTLPLLSLSLLAATPRASAPADALWLGTADVATEREYCSPPPASRLGDDEAPLPGCRARDYIIWAALLREAAARQTGHVDVSPVIPLPKSLATLGLPRYAAAKPGRLGFAPVDARGLEALFKVLYVPPTARLGSHTAQALYDALLAPSVRMTARFIGRMEASPKLVDALLPMVRARAAAAAAAKKDVMSVYFDLSSLLFDDAWVDASQYTAATAVGFVLRRKLDGSWPTVRRLLERVLSDYDATALALLKGGTDALDGRALVRFEVSPADNPWTVNIDDARARFGETLKVAVVAQGPRVFTFTGNEGGQVEVRSTIAPAGGQVKARLERDRWAVEVTFEKTRGELRLDGKPAGSFYLWLTPGHHVVEAGGPCIVPERLELDVTLARRPVAPTFAGVPLMTRLRVDLVDADGAPVEGTWTSPAAEGVAGVETALPLCTTWLAVGWPDGTRSVSQLNLKPDTLNVVRVPRPPPAR